MAAAGDAGPLRLVIAAAGHDEVAVEGITAVPADHLRQVLAIAIGPGPFRRSEPPIDADQRIQALSDLAAVVE